MRNATWFLYSHPVGRVTRESTTSSFHVLCPRCGIIWAKCQGDTTNYWTCSHMACSACGLGTLVGADWTSRPFTPFNLPTALLTRELDLASSHPDTYNP